MSSDLLVELVAELDRPQVHFAGLERYAEGLQDLAFISPESRKALGNRLSRMVSNIPRLALSSLGERLAVSGFSDPRAWDLYVASDLNQLAGQAIYDALLYGAGFILVWGNASVESPRQCAVLRDPADRTVSSGIKRYCTSNESHAYLYLPDRVEHWVAARTQAAAADFELVEVLENPLGVVPLVPISNGHSEIQDLLPLCDALNKLLLDMMCASEAAGKPRRWISGLELTERPRVNEDGSPVLDADGNPVIDVVNPIQDINTIQTMIAESENTKFGQLAATDLTGFKDGVQVLISQISAISALPAHYLSPLTAAQVPSADGLRAAEASIVARAEAKQLAFGRAFEQVGRLLVAADTGIDPVGLPLKVQWRDASTRSASQDADMAVKLFQANILDRVSVLQKLGYDDDAIALIEARIELNAQQARDISLGRYAGALGRAA